MVTLKYLGVRNGRKTINRKTPVMTLQGLQRLLVFLGGKGGRRVSLDRLGRLHAVHDRDRPMVVVVNLNDKEHPQVPRFM